MEKALRTTCGTPHYWPPVLQEVCSSSELLVARAFGPRPEIFEGDDQDRRNWRGFKTKWLRATQAKRCDVLHLRRLGRDLTAFRNGITTGYFRAHCFWVKRCLGQGNTNKEDNELLGLVMPPCLSCSAQLPLQTKMSLDHVAGSTTQRVSQGHVFCKSHTQNIAPADLLSSKLSERPWVGFSGS